MDVRPCQSAGVDRARGSEGVPANLYRRGDTWYARLAVAGRLRRISLRTSDQREAKRRLAALRLKAGRQLFGIADAATWKTAVSAYAAGVLDAGALKPGTATRYRVSLRQLDQYFGPKTLPEITTPEVARYVAARQQSGATNATIRRDLTTLSRVLAFARAQGLTDQNAGQDFDRSLIRERRAAIAVPTDAAIERAAKSVELAGELELAALIRFLRANGLRTGEALRARWSDVAEGHLTIPETKSGRVRTIDVLGLPQRRRGAERLFPGLPEDSGGVASLWQWARAELPAAERFRLHDLRHAYAIAEIRGGRDIYDLSHHLGHSSVRVTEIYLGYVPGHRRPTHR